MPQIRKLITNSGHIKQCCNTTHMFEFEFLCCNLNSISLTLASQLDYKQDKGVFKTKYSVCKMCTLLKELLQNKFELTLKDYNIF